MSFYHWKIHSAMNFIETYRKAAKYTIKLKIQNNQEIQENQKTSVFDMMWMPKKLHGI